jgi:hypothetical protein
VHCGGAGVGGEPGTSEGEGEEKEEGEKHFGGCEVDGVEMVGYVYG